jgi:calcineurin-like phosphoesterase family protein
VSNTWFTSDVHIGHRLVAELRGFGDDVAAHDQAIAAAWDVVGKDDTVWVLGDLAVSSPVRALALLADLPGEKHLIWGNHDQGHPMHRDAHRRARKYLEVFASVQAFSRRRVAGREVLLSHFPYIGDTTGRAKDRHTQYRLRDEGVPIIHGHTHSRFAVSYARQEPYPTPGTLQLHVGVDAHAMRLVPLAWVEHHVTSHYARQEA